MEKDLKFLELNTNASKEEIEKIVNKPKQSRSVQYNIFTYVLIILFSIMLMNNKRDRYVWCCDYSNNTNH